jgi:EmrB/QacA subfamily drug resistance transporter
MGALDNLVVVTTLPQIVTDLHNTSALSFVVSAYLIASTVATPIFGKLSDLYSRRDFFIVGLVIFIIGSLLAGVAQSLPELIAFRAIQGFGSGAFFPVGLAIIAVQFSPETRAKLTGAFSSIFGIATIVGPFLGSYIVDHTTWRWVFYVNLPIGFAAIFIVRAAMGPLRPLHPKRFDALGAGLLSGWVAAFMLALVLNSDQGWAWTDARIVGLLAATVVLFVAFVFWELRTDEPVVPLRFFKQRVVAANSAIAFFRGGLLFSFSTFISIFVAFILLGDADTVRDVLWWLVIPMILGSAVGGTLMTRLPYRTLLVVGTALASLGAYFTSTIGAGTPLWTFTDGFLLTGGIVLFLVPLGFGIGMTFAPTAVAVQYAVPPKDIGAASSLVQFLSSLGGAVAVSLLSSYEQARFLALDPAPAGVACAIPPVFPFPVGCDGFYSLLRSSTATAYTETFFLLFGIALAAFVASLFVTGRLPRSRGPGAPAPAPTE